MEKNILKQIPKKVREAYKALKSAGYEVFLVGGCVRDLIMARKPNDWDLTTNALPEKIQSLFKNSFYDNIFGTVRLPLDGKNFIEITTYRSESLYKDKRHPEKIEFGKSLLEDLKRRDFTINAIALEIKNINTKKEDYTLIDIFGSQEDIKRKIIRAVGNPQERFQEDALRLLRAVRFSSQLDFEIEKQTYQAITDNASLLKYISQERIRDELVKIINSKKPAKAFFVLKETDLLKYIIPELEEGIGILQGRHHKHDVFTHSILSLQAAADKDFNFEVRMAALLHDVAKPRTRDFDQKGQATFYNHQLLGAKMAKNILKRLKFDNKTIEKIVLLVKEHMFVYDIGKVSEAGVRRLLRKVGKENINDLINLRIADRLGSGVPKAMPYRLRHLLYLLEKVSSDPISLKVLKISGNDIMEILKIEPSKRIGLLLNALLVKVLDNPKINKKELLKKELLKLNKLEDKELEKFKQDLDYKKQKRDIGIRKKYYLKEKD